MAWLEQHKNSEALASAAHAAKMEHDLAIDSVELFADCEIASSLKELALLAGACFSTIEDVPSYVSRLRRTEDGSGGSRQRP